MSEVGEFKPLLLGFNIPLNIPPRQEILSAVLKKLGNTSKPAPQHTYFPRLTGCKGCGSEHSKAETCLVLKSTEVCGYCGKAGHVPDVCHALHNVCGLCLVRGHRTGTECPDDLRQALQRFEQWADYGQFTRLRHADPSWGFFFFDQRWSMMKIQVAYGELLCMAPEAALWYANRPFATRVLQAQAAERGTKREAASDVDDESAPVTGKRFKRLENTVLEMASLLKAGTQTKSPSLGDRTDRRGKGRGRGTPRGSRGGGKSKSSNTKQISLEDVRNFFNSQSSGDSGSRGTYGDYKKKRGKGRGKGHK
jgi:hypothetical protein